MRKGRRNEESRRPEEGRPVWPGRRKKYRKSPKIIFFGINFFR
jgi:hypothetical protein